MEFRLKLDMVIELDYPDVQTSKDGIELIREGLTNGTYTYKLLKNVTIRTIK